MPTFWSQRHVFVTGATGLMGSWLTRRLVARGAQVVCLVRQDPQARWRDEFRDRVTCVRGDLSDQGALEAVLAEHAIETVFHLGAQTLVGVANRDPVPTFEANIGGTWRLLEACRQRESVRAVVLASSDKAYGDQPKLPYEETMSLAGKHPYDVSKSCADLLGQTYAHSYGLPVGITRCGNLFGGGDLNWSRIVPGTIRAVVHGKRPVIRSDGKAVRDYIYVEDAAEAYLTLAEHLTGDPALAGEAFNFSYEQPLSALEMVERVLRAMGSDLAPEIRNEASNEIQAQYLSSEKARTQLGWRPTGTLHDGLGRTVAWYTELLSRSEET